MRTEVVIFRNPIEAFYWDNPEILLALLGCALGIILLIYVWSKIMEWWQRRK